MENRIIVIGAGASGMMAAARAAESGAEVLLLEKTDRPGQKILVSGKTRCNLTNSAELDDFILAYGANGPFLYSVFSRFFREDLLALMRRYGVETKTERGGRIFPASDDAHDVVKALQRYMAEYQVKLETGVGVGAILAQNGSISGVKTGGIAYPAKAVILAAGGSSWPSTGSSGDGYRLAESLGHGIVKLRAALVPLKVEEADLARSMQGLSLKNVRLSAYSFRADEIDAAPFKKPFDSLMGEMMLTHFGIGGPITLQMSLGIVKALEKGPVSVAIDLKPALDQKQLQSRLQRDFDNGGKRTFHNLLKELVPLKMIGPLVELSGIPVQKPGHQITAVERERLGGLLKSLRFNITGSLPLSAGMVTAGGVSLKEIDPRTMSSRLVKGLYFCGEVMDIDADTGGYNLQAAFSSGYLAGQSAAEYVVKG